MNENGSVDTTNNAELASYQMHLQGMLSAVVQRSGIPGVSLAIAANGVRVFATAGTAAANKAAVITENSRFEIGTMGKALLSLVILDLVAHDELNLDSCVADLLPEFEASGFGEQVRLRHLLCHSGGYQSPNLADATLRKTMSWSGFVALLRDVPFLFEPGTVFSFTPSAPVLIAEIIRRVTSVSATELVQKRIVEPLALSCGARTESPLAVTRVESHKFDASTGSFMPSTRHTFSSLWAPAFSDATMTISDVVTIAESIAKARSSGNGTAFLSRTAAALAQEQNVELPFLSGGRHCDRLPTSVGLGFAEFLPDWYGSNGPITGQSVSVRYSGTYNVALAVGINAHPAYHLIEAIIHQILLSLVGETRMPEPKEDPLTPQADELSGKYSGSLNSAISVSTQGRDVVCELPATADVSGTRVLMQRDEFNRWVVRSDPGRFALGFFREPNTGTPCLMVGATAYKKVS